MPRIEVDLDQVKVFLNEVKTRALVRATRKSMNRSLSALQTRANKKAREHRKLKAREIKKDFFNLKKAKGNHLHRIEAELGVSGRPMSLLRFVVGQKEPRRQKGIPMRSRRKVQVEVRPGRKVKLDSAFIAKGKGGKNQVFRRRTKSRAPIVKQSVPALSTLFARKKIETPLRLFARRHFLKEFGRTFDFELNKLNKKR